MNEKVKKPLVFSDVDGTLYGPNFSVREDTKKDIKNFIEKNNGDFIITTGNPPFEKHQNLAADLGVRYLITSNGATIFDNLEKKYIYKNVFSHELQNKIINLAKETNLQLNYWTDEKYFTLNRNKEFERSYHYSLNDVSFVQDSDSTYDNTVKMELFGPQEIISKAYEEIKDLDLNIVHMRKEHIEITPKNSSKGIAMKWFSENIYQENIENVMAIGDSPNDWSMLSIAGFSYAMANANKETKQVAKYNTSAYDQNGVGMAIMDYLHRIKNKL